VAVGELRVPIWLARLAMVSYSPRHHLFYYFYFLIHFLCCSLSLRRRRRRGYKRRRRKKVEEEELKQTSQISRFLRSGPPADYLKKMRAAQFSSSSSSSSCIKKKRIATQSAGRPARLLFMLNSEQSQLSSGSDLVHGRSPSREECGGGEENAHNRERWAWGRNMNIQPAEGNENKNHRVAI
jgi:hypothetical protein